MIFFQATACSPVGNECYNQYVSQHQEQVSESCLKPCQGLYGDILHLNQEDTVILSKNGEPTAKIFEEYLNYKRSFTTNYLHYFTNITEQPLEWGSGIWSPYINSFVTKDVNYCNNKYFDDCRSMVKAGAANCGVEHYCVYDLEERLQVVEIYFDTPTFDKITMDARTSFVTKLSLIGGTLGLFTGNSQVFLSSIYCDFLRFQSTQWS